MSISNYNDGILIKVIIKSNEDKAPMEMARPSISRSIHGLLAE